MFSKHIRFIFFPPFYFYPVVKNRLHSKVDRVINACIEHSFEWILDQLTQADKCGFLSLKMKIHAFSLYLSGIADETNTYLDRQNTL